MSKRTRALARAAAAKSAPATPVVRRAGPKYDSIMVGSGGYMSVQNGADIGAPSTGKSRLDQDYRHATGAGPNAVVLSNLNRDRARSRHEYLHNEYAARAKQLRVDYAVGAGLRPHIKGDPKLQLFWDTFVENSDPRGFLDYYAQQAQALSEDIEGGEVIVLPRRRRPEDGLRVPLQVQVVESEYLPTIRLGGMPDSAIAGIELDLERPVGYWLYERHPAEGLTFGGDLPPVKRYGADRVCHIFDSAKARAGQLRGAPSIAKALARMRQVEKYESADLHRKQTAALLGVAVRMPSADDDLPDVLKTGSDQREEGQPYAMAPLEPGAILGLPPGADIDIINPNDSSTGYKEAWQTRYMGIATGLGVPYFLLTGDFAGVNERSLRVGMLDFFRQVKADRKRLNHQMNRKVWSFFLEAAERAGWKPPAGKTRADYERVEWIGEPLPHIHPVQEIQAQVNAIRAGIKTLGQVHQENGTDLETFLAEKALENAAIDAIGASFDTDPRRLTKAGGYQSVDLPTPDQAE